MYLIIEIDSPSLRALAIGTSAAFAFSKHRISATLSTQHDQRRVIILRRGFITRAVARFVIGAFFLFLVKSGSLFGIFRLGETTLRTALHKYTLRAKVRIC